MDEQEQSATLLIKGGPVVARTEPSGWRVSRYGDGILIRQRAGVLQ